MNKGAVVILSAVSFGATISVAGIVVVIDVIVVMIVVAARSLCGCRQLCGHCRCFLFVCYFHLLRRQSVPLSFSLFPSSALLLPLLL